MTEKSGSSFSSVVRQRASFWVARTKVDFAVELADLMARRAVSRTELAQKIGVSPAYVTKALRGDTNFTIESMVKLVYALGGRLNLHVTAQEDRTHWADIIGCNLEEPAGTLEISDAFKSRPGKVAFRTDEITGAYVDVSTSLAA